MVFSENTEDFEDSKL